MAGVRRFAGLAALVLVLSACVTIDRVNTNASGGQSAVGVEQIDTARVATSADGRYVAFASAATDLVPGVTDGKLHVYRKDRATGAIAVADRDSAAKVNPSWGSLADLSEDGTRVAFVTDAPLVGADTNTLADVYVRNVSAGTTVLASVMPDGSQIPSGVQAGAYRAQFDATGTKLLFEAGANTLPPRNLLELRDLDAGTTVEALGNSQVTDFRLSGDAKHVFANRGCFQVGGCFPTPLVVDLASPYPFSPNGSFCGGSSAVAQSDDGRYLVFYEGGLAPGCNNRNLVYDRTDGSIQEISLGGTNGLTVGVAGVSGDLRFALMRGEDGVLPGGTAGRQGLFLLDRTTGHAERVSANAANITGDATLDYHDDEVISTDGRTVVFTDVATNLVSSDTNGGHDVFARVGPAPVISNVSPSSLARGASHKSVTIGGFEFLPFVFATAGDGVTIHSATPNAAGTTLVLDVSVAANAPTGSRVLTIANPAAVGIAGTPCACLTVT